MYDCEITHEDSLPASVSVQGSIPGKVNLPFLKAHVHPYISSKPVQSIMEFITLFT